MAGVLISKPNFSGATLVRSGKCLVKHMKFVNEDTATRFCQIFDSASVAAVTVGTTAHDYVMTAGSEGGEGVFMGELVFANGIVIAATTTGTGAAASAGPSHFYVAIE